MSEHLPPDPFASDYSGFTLPFAEQPATSLPDADQLVMTGGLVVMGAVIPSAFGCFPALVFRFEGSDRTLLRPVALVLDPARMAGIPDLVDQAARAAIARAAERA